MPFCVSQKHAWNFKNILSLAKQTLKPMFGKGFHFLLNMKHP